MKSLKLLFSTLITTISINALADIYYPPILNIDSDSRFPEATAEITYLKGCADKFIKLETSAPEHLGGQATMKVRVVLDAPGPLDITCRALPRPVKARLNYDNSVPTTLVADSGFEVDSDKYQTEKFDLHYELRGLFIHPTYLRKLEVLRSRVPEGFRLKMAQVEKLTQTTSRFSRKPATLKVHFVAQKQTGFTQFETKALGSINAELDYPYDVPYIIRSIYIDAE